MSAMAPGKSLFLQACAGQVPAVTPVWLMRQAGRILEPYRELRKKHGSIDRLFNTPDLAAQITLMPVELLGQLLGRNGTELWRRANAIDESAVVPYTEAKSISTERTFEQDTMDVRWLKTLLLSMVEKLAFKLRSQQKLSGCLTVKIRYSSFDTVSRQAHLTYTSADHVLIEKAQELFDKLYDRRLLIRLLGVRLSELVQGCQQIDLFGDTPEQIRLYQAMDRMRSKHGATALMRAASLGLVSARPDFNPFAKN